jgi:hypothetical protein
MAKRHSPEFGRQMAKFYKQNKNAGLEKARKHAAKLGYPEFSKGAHDEYRKKVGVNTRRTKTRKAAAAGEPEAPKRCWRDLSTGKFCANFELGKPGTKVAIYEQVATGAISLSYPIRRKRRAN